MTADTFEQELEALINRYSQENLSNTPDFILAEFLLLCLVAWNHATTERERWYGRIPRETALGPPPESPDAESTS
jgi:hypothetical protein